MYDAEYDGEDDADDADADYSGYEDNDDEDGYTNNDVGITGLVSSMLRSEVIGTSRVMFGRVYWQCHISLVLIVKCISSNDKTGYKL